MKTPPTFIGIGAQKCATTWLYDLLSLHPAVGLSTVKEIHFFSQYFGHGLQWYESHFRECEPTASAIGEFSTSYFADLAAPQRVKQAYPDSQLILMLRDPIARLISNHKHEIRIGHFSGPDLSYEAGIENNPSYIQQGLYAQHLERWLEYFDREQIHIIIFDDINKAPELVERNLYQFLHVQPQQACHLLDKSNSSYLYRSHTTEKLRRSGLNLIRKLGLESSYRQAVKRSGLQSAYRKMNRADFENTLSPLKPETRTFLQEVFRPEINRLEQLSGIKLDNWMR